MKNLLTKALTLYTVCFALTLAAFAMPPPKVAGNGNFEVKAKGEEQTQKQPGSHPNMDVAIATFAGGCFWCMEKPFDELDGVLSTVSGYTGGHLSDPSYKDVSRGGTGHYEVVQVSYNPHKISYKALLQTFWVNIDPLDPKGQFCDKGSQYLSAIFYHDSKQKLAAEQSLKSLSASGRLEGEIVTPILQASKFYPAEEYHQDYYKKNPWRYKYYRHGCGRDKRLKAIWSK